MNSMSNHARYMRAWRINKLDDEQLIIRYETLLNKIQLLLSEIELRGLIDD